MQQGTILLELASKHVRLVTRPSSLTIFFRFLLALSQVMDRNTKNKFTTWPFSKFREAVYDMKEYYQSTIGQAPVGMVSGGSLVGEERYALVGCVLRIFYRRLTSSLASLPSLRSLSRQGLLVPGSRPQLRLPSQPFI